MSSKGEIRVACSRCGKTFFTEESTFEANNGDVYCEECLVPFICDNCGERRYTIPEKVSDSDSLICTYCERQRTNNPNLKQQTGTSNLISLIKSTISAVVIISAMVVIGLLVGLLLDWGQITNNISQILPEGAINPLLSVFVLVIYGLYKLSQ